MRAGHKREAAGMWNVFSWWRFPPSVISNFSRRQSAPDVDQKPHDDLAHI